MSMHIISPGMLTTVQDLGRRGYMASGFQQGGAMDQFAARAANILLDNSESDGVLEMTLLGVKAYFDEDNVIAITGAEFAPTVTDSETGEVTELPMNCAVRVKKGDVLDCGSARSGLRGYLAVAGGFDIAPVMGSMSTNLKCKVGGFDGRKLKSGDVLPLRYPQSDLYGMTSRVFEPEKQKDGTVTVHVIPGPQDDYFSDKGKNIFYSETYSVTGDSDRMGIKLDGTPVESVDGVDIISDGIVAGSVQIPSSGKLPDRPFWRSARRSGCQSSTRSDRHLHCRSSTGNCRCWTADRLRFRSQEHCRGSATYFRGFQWCSSWSRACPQDR